MMKKIFLCCSLIFLLCACDKQLDKNYRCNTNLDGINLQYDINSKEGILDTITLQFVIEDQNINLDFTTIDELHKTNIIQDTTNSIKTYLNNPDLNLTHEFKEHTLIISLPLSIQNDLSLIESIFTIDLNEKTDINTFIKSLEQANVTCDLN